MLLNWIKKQIFHKIQVSKALTIIRNFRRKLKIVDSLRCMIFGQQIKLDSDDQKNAKKMATIAT